MYYVYAWFEPDGTIFYIGKGTAYRYSNRTRRNKYWKNIEAKHRANGLDVYVQILHQDLTEELSLKIERDLILQYTPRANMTDGGQGSIGYKHTPDALARTGAAQKELWSSLDYRDKMTASRKGYVRSEAAKIASAEKHRGMKRPLETGEKIAASKRGKPRSEETKQKIRETLLQRQKQSARVTGNY